MADSAARGHRWLAVYRKQGCAYLRIRRSRWLVVHWFTKPVKP